MTTTAVDVVEPLGYAEYGQRVRAAIVDSLLITFAVGALVFGLSVFAARGGPFANLLSTLAYLIYLAGATLYYTVCYAEGGQTIGKMTTRTAVRLDGDEDRAVAALGPQASDAPRQARRQRRHPGLSATPLAYWIAVNGTGSATAVPSRGGSIRAARKRGLLLPDHRRPAHRYAPHDRDLVRA